MFGGGSMGSPNFGGPSHPLFSRGIPGASFGARADNGFGNGGNPFSLSAGPAGRQQFSGAEMYSNQHSNQQRGAFPSMSGTSGAGFGYQNRGFRFLF